MTLLDKIGETGELPAFKTSVGLDRDGIINLGITLIVVAIVIMLMYKIILSK